MSEQPRITMPKLGSLSAAADADEPARWTVHILFVDGTEDEARGEATVEDGVLMVRVQRPYSNDLLFETGYPLRHVKSWWIDYEETS